MMPFLSLWQPLYLLGGLSMVLFHCLEDLAFWVAFSLYLGLIAYSGHIFRPFLHAFWVRFLGTFVDSKGLLRFVPLILTSFLNFRRVSGTFAAALLEHSAAGIAIALTSRGSSLMKINPTSPASQGR
jgi:xanthine/uracil/vitamin C permease (AzgA family)